MTIYTAIFGDYDELKEPGHVTEGWEYICYTNQPFKSDVWKVIKVETEKPVFMARSLKIATPNGKSIWIDGSFVINCDLNRFWDENFISPMTVIQHPIRNCAYEEAAACQKNKRANIDDIARQIGRYADEGLPMNSGVIQSGIILREYTKEVMNFCRLWWKQIELSTRDQIGFAYAEWKMGIKWPRVEGFDYRTSTDFIYKTHKHRRNVKAH